MHAETFDLKFRREIERLVDVCRRQDTEAPLPRALQLPVRSNGGGRWRTAGRYDERQRDSRRNTAEPLQHRIHSHSHRSTILEMHVAGQRQSQEASEYEEMRRRSGRYRESLAGFNDRQVAGASMATGCFGWTRAATSPGTDGVEEACVADLGGILHELDVDPCDDVTERAVLEGPSCSLCRSQIVIGDLLEHYPPLYL